jgi:hypothetical protein
MAAYPAVVAALLILCAPYLALIALAVILLAAVATLVAFGAAIVADLRVLSRSVRSLTGTTRRSTEEGSVIRAAHDA